MILNELLNLLSETTHVRLINDNTFDVISDYTYISTIPGKYRNNTINKLCVCSDKESRYRLNIYIDCKEISYFDLTAEKRINCLYDYIYKVVPYENYNELDSVTDVETDVIELLAHSNMAIDYNGVWIDESGNRY